MSLPVQCWVGDFLLLSRGVRNFEPNHLLFGCFRFVFANSLEQKRLAESSKHGLAETGFLGQPIVTLIEMAGPFYPAEDYHQNYYEKNPIRYEFYRFRCGRDARIRELWGKEAHSGIMK